MRLADYIAANGLSHKQMADRIRNNATGQNVTGQAVRYWARGERMPTPEIVDRIVEATDGDVTVGDLHEAVRDFRGSVGTAA